MQDALSDTFHVTLMGPPQITPLGRTQITAAGQDGERIGGDADVLNLLALIVLCRFLPDPTAPDSLAPGAYDVQRRWLTENFDPEGLARNRKKTQDNLAYALKKLDGALGIRINHGIPEHTFLEVSLDHLTIDVRLILIAARQLTKEENQEFVIRHGAKRLLDGTPPSISDLPDIRMMRLRLDEHYLDALHYKITNLLVKMESAALLDTIAEADENRASALLHLKQARERLKAMGDGHLLAAQFDALHARAVRPHAAGRDPGSQEPPAFPFPRHNIPRRITSFVGREAEMTKLETLLGTEHLVTIKGMGGCGKTRLALQAALDYAERSGEEARLVELAGVADPDSVPQTVAAVFGLSDQKQGTYVDALITRLQAGRPLLLLDNCEHLVTACAFLAEKLVQNCPNLIVLATSRQLLNIDGEHPVPIKPLRAPPAGFASLDPSDPNAALRDYEAARLFIDRIRPYDVAATEENAAAVSSICARLDGIPLALEMAAARAAELSLPEIDRRLTDRFLFLTNGKRTALPRHETLHAVIEWSYDLLAERERTLFRRLSVFAGGWTMEAAQSVGASGDIAESDVPGLLEALLHKSLVTEDPTASPARYGMLETVREYAKHRLNEHGEMDAMQEKHQAFFLNLAEDARIQLNGPDPVPCLERLEGEIDNLRAAMSWRADEASLRLACALYRFWLIRSYFQEGRQWLERTWDEPERLPVHGKATALMNAGSLACHQNNFPDAERLLKESRAHWALTGDHIGQAEVLYHLGITATFQTDFAAAEELLQESLALALAAGNETGAVGARYALGRVAQARTDLAQARECYEAILPVRRRQEDLVELADLLMYMGLVATYQDRRAESRDLLTESLGYATRLGRTHQIAQLNGALAELARVCGDYLAARTHCDTALSLMQKVGAKLGLAHLTNLRAIIAYDQEDFEEAEKGFERSRAMMIDFGNERVAVGLLLNLASAAGKQGKYERAGKLFRESLAGLLTYEAWQWIAGNLEEFGHLEACHTPRPFAVTLLIAADMLRNQVRYFRTDLEASTFEAALRNLRSELGDAIFGAARDRACAMTKEQAVAYALEEGEW